MTCTQDLSVVSCRDPFWDRYKIASLLLYTFALSLVDRKAHTHTRARQLSENMPAITCVFSLRDGSLFFSVSPANLWILIVVCFLGTRAPQKNSSSLSSSFLPSFERRRRRKRKSDDEISICVIVSRWLRYPLCARVVRPSSIGRLGEISLFVEILNPLEFPLSTIKTTGPENKVNSSSPPPSSPPPPRFFPQLVLKRTTTTTTTTATTTTSRANVLQDYPSTAIRDDDNQGRVGLPRGKREACAKPRRTRPSVRATITSCKRTTITALTIRSHMMSSMSFTILKRILRLPRQKTVRFGSVKLPSSRLFECHDHRRKHRRRNGKL